MNEKDFVEKFSFISNLFKEVFPNIEINENVDKLSRLEMFEVFQYFILDLYQRSWKSELDG